jgi:hypothetical protein
MQRIAAFLDKLEDGPDALTVRHTPAPGPRPYTGRQRNVSLGIPPEHELFRIRTRPELYPDWLVQQVHTHRAALAARVDMFDWDCHACESAVFTHGITDACPRCHTNTSGNASRAA